MTDRPIIFSAPMVRALLDGRKTQTRRVLKRQPKVLKNGIWYRPYPVLRPLQWSYLHGDKVAGFVDVSYAPGDRLYVREQCATWGRGPEREPVEFPVAYAADDTEWDDIKHDARNSKTGDEWKIRPSIHMPRWASRLTLTVTDVRVQRLQEISQDDAKAEGIASSRGGWWSGADGQAGDTPRAAFALLWNSLHGPGAWAENPWIVALTFTVQHGNIDQLAVRP